MKSAAEFAAEAVELDMQRRRARFIKIIAARDAAVRRAAIEECISTVRLSFHQMDNGRQTQERLRALLEEEAP